MAAVPSGYTAGAPVNGVTPLYNAENGLIAGTMQNGKTNIIGSDATPAQAAVLRGFPNEIGVSGAQSATPAQTQGTSYLTAAGGQPGSGNMTWNDIQNSGYGASDIAAFQQKGWTPDQVMTSIQKGYAQPPSQSQTSTPQQDAFGVTRKDSGKGYTTLTTNKGQTVNVDNAGNYFTTDSAGNNTPVTDQQAQAMGFQSSNPESQAIKQMGQIDPGTEALRSQVASSYTDPNAAANPTAAQYQLFRHF